MLTSILLTITKPPRLTLLCEVPMHVLGLQELRQPILAQLARRR
jgi:hypothetical protein